MTRAAVAPRPFSPQRPYLFRPMRLDPAGVDGPTPGAARGRSYRRTSRGLYLPASVTDDLPEQRIVEAAANLPAGGGVTGWAALRWLGARWFTGRRADGAAAPVVLATGYNDIVNQPGHLVSQERLGPGELEIHDGLPVTFAVRSLYYAVRYAAGLREAVALVDMCAYDDVVSIAEIWAYAVANPGWTGAPQARAAILLADENSWSPRESAWRLCWLLDAELPAPLTNRPLFDRAGRHLATPDLLDDEAGVVVEYDGETHLDPGRRRNDVGRGDLYRSLDLELVVITAGMTRESVVERMVAARARARFLPSADRSWTVAAPEWWVPTHTVAMRRGLDAQQRARCLRYRHAVA